MLLASLPTGFCASAFCAWRLPRPKIHLVTAIIFAHSVLNVMRLRYPGVHQEIADGGKNHSLVTVQWRQGVNLQDMEEATGSNMDTKIG